MPPVFTKTKLLQDSLIYLALCSEGRSVKDKAAILLHLVLAPSRILFRAVTGSCSHPLVCEVEVKNADGRFSCGRSFTSCRAVSSLYERDLKDVIRLNQGVFVDVGAHVGKYTIRLANSLKTCGHVIAVEPEKHNFNMLKRNVELNRLHNVHLANVACGAEDGEMTLYVTNNYTTLHSAYKRTSRKSVVVKCRRLDTLLSQLSIESVDLIKVDVEGAEADVIRGSKNTLLRHHPRIVFEAWNSRQLQEVEGLLSGFGYNIARLNEENYIAH